MLDNDVLMLMLTCEVGDAMNRTANLRTLIKTFTYVDDFLGAGKDHVRHAASVVHEIIRGAVRKEKRTRTDCRNTCNPS